MGSVQLLGRPRAADGLGGDAQRRLRPGLQGAHEQSTIGTPLTGVTSRSGVRDPRAAQPVKEFGSCSRGATALNSSRRPDCGPLIERFCSIIVSEVEENVMLSRWDKPQFGGEVGWRA